MLFVFKQLTGSIHTQCRVNETHHETTGQNAGVEDENRMWPQTEADP